jgi:hypothetical protein
MKEVNKVKEVEKVEEIFTFVTIRGNSTTWGRMETDFLNHSYLEAHPTSAPGLV